ncbi:MAG: hypothetical protein IPG67_14795 [Acidobacteria bacterium]|nr:hypothetical protein [Acidobacteriota bacterium]
MGQKYFWASRRVTRSSIPTRNSPSSEKEIRVSVGDSLAPLPRRYMVWHGVRQYAPDEPAWTS